MVQLNKWFKLAEFPMVTPSPLLSCHLVRRLHVTWLLAWEMTLHWAWHFLLFIFIFIHLFCVPTFLGTSFRPSFLGDSYLINKVLKEGMEGVIYCIHRREKQPFRPIWFLLLIYYYFRNLYIFNNTWIQCITQIVITRAASLEVDFSCTPHICLFYS